MVNLFTKLFVHKVTLPNVSKMIRKKERIGKYFVQLAAQQKSMALMTVVGRCD